MVMASTNSTIANTNPAHLNFIFGFCEVTIKKKNKTHELSNTLLDQVNRNGNGSDGSAHDRSHGRLI